MIKLLIFATILILNPYINFFGFKLNSLFFILIYLFSRVLIKNVFIPKSNIKITYYFSFLIFLGFILVILNYLRYPQNPISLVPFTYLLSVIFITIAYSFYLNEKIWSSFSIFDCLTVLRNVIFFTIYMYFMMIYYF